MARPLHVLYTNVSCSTTAGSKEVVAAVSGKKIRVLGVQLMPAAANIATLQTSTGGILYGPYNSTGNRPLAVAPTALGLFETADSKSVKIQLQNAAAVVTALQYVLADS